jgi:hypothetical protein
MVSKSGSTLVNSSLDLWKSNTARVVISPKKARFCSFAGILYPKSRSLLCSRCTSSPCISRVNVRPYNSMITLPCCCLSLCACFHLSQHFCKLYQSRHLFAPKDERLFSKSSNPLRSRFDFAHFQISQGQCLSAWRPFYGDFEKKF